MSKLIVEAGTLYKKAQGEPGEGPSFEQQFGILANAQNTDKYPSLGNYQVAVQMLDKNDDNSFAVCIVIYKLGTNYIYIPAVFNKGKIYTTELMEVPGMQTMLPVSDAWLNWVKNKDNKGDATVIPAQEGNNYGSTPESTRSREPQDPLLKGASLKEPSGSPSLFDTALKMGKRASFKLLDYLGKEEFMNQTFKFYSPQEIQGFVKKACELFPEKPQTELITVLDKRASLLTEEEKKTLWRDGYVIKRAQAVDWDIDKAPVQVVQKKDISQAFVTPGESCKCDMLLDDGTTESVQLIMAKTDRYKGMGDRAYEMKGLSTPSINSLEKSGMVKLIVEDGEARPVRGVVTAIKDSIEKLDFSKIGKAFSEFDSGELVLLLPSGSAIYYEGYFHKEKDGTLYSYDKVIKESQDDRLRESINYDKVIEVPKGTRVLPVGRGLDSARNVSVADLGRTIERFTNKVATKIKMTSDGQEVSFYGPASKPSDRFMEKDAALHLVKTYGIAPKEAKAMLKKAGFGQPGAPRTFTFLMLKNAAFSGSDEESDLWKPADIGYEEVEDTPPKINNEDLQSKAMSEEEQMDVITKATDAGVKEVFDTAALKLLMQDADPHETVMDAVPDFMRTLDSLCQLLFVYRCHMQDMEQTYGAVKMKALQKSLQNTIKDLSQLTIFVKLRGLGNGESPDAGDLQTGTLMQ